MRTLLLCLFLVGVGACDGDDCPLQADAAAAAPDAAPDAALPDAAAAADAAPPDAVPCGSVGEMCCRIGDSCEPGLGCVAHGLDSECVSLADGAP